MNGRAAGRFPRKTMAMLFCVIAASPFIYGRVKDAVILYGIEVDIDEADKVDNRVLTYDTSEGQGKFKLQQVSASAGVNSITAGTNVTLGGTASDPIINSSGATSLNIQQGGSAFASGVDTLNLNGMTLTRSAGTLTVTNAVSTTSFLTGDGSSTTPVSPTYKSEFFTLDGSNQLTLRPGGQGNGVSFTEMATIGASVLMGTTASGRPQEIGPFGSMQISGGGSLIVNCRVPILDASSAVSLTYDGRVFDLNGSNQLAMRLGSGLTVENGLGLFMPIQAGGSAFADVNTVNFVGGELTRSGPVLTYTNKVSVTGSNLSGDGSAGSPLAVSSTTALAVQAGGSGFASGIDTINFVGEQLSRSANVLTVTSKVSTTNVVTGDGSDGFALDIAAGASNTFMQTTNAGAVTFAALNKASPLTGQGTSGGTALDVLLNEPLMDSSGISLRYKGVPFTLDGSNNFDLRYGPGIKEGNGIELDMPVQVGGSLFSFADTLNLVGFEVSRSADVLTVTNKISATDEGASGASIDTVDVSGRMASMVVASNVGTVNVSPTTFQDSRGIDFGSFPYIRLGTGFTFSSSQPDVIDINVPAPSSTVSTQAPITGDGSGGSPVALAFDSSLENEGGSLSLNGPVQVGGSAFANFKTLNLVGFTVSRSGDLLTVTNAVSTSGDITGDGSSGSPVTFTDPGVIVQAGGSAFANPVKTINWVGEELSRSGTVLTVTSKVSASSPLSGDGSSGSPLDLTIGTGLEDSSGLRLAMVWQDEDAGSTAAQSGNVSGSQVSVSHSGGEATINHTPTTFQNAAGSDIGSFPYVRFGDGLVPTQAQPDTIAVDGKFLQLKHEFATYFTSTTATIPHDDSIPQQSTDGGEVLTATITPKRADSTLIVTAQAVLHGSAATDALALALFRDSTEDAFAVVYSGVAAAGTRNLYVTAAVTPTSTAATTIKMKVGNSSGTTSLSSGDGPARVYGGSATAGIIIMEVLP